MSDIVSLEKVKESVNKLVRAGLPKNDVLMAVQGSSIYAKSNHERRKAIEQSVENILKNHNNYETIQNIMNNQVILLSDTGKLCIFDKKLKTEQLFNRDVLNQFMNISAISDKIVLCKPVYNPTRFEKIYNTDKINYYNTYKPPKWLEDKFYYGIDISSAEMPETYKVFLNHLVDGSETNIEFIINWMAYSLKGKNNTVLTAIGDQGTGKGMLATVIACLHGGFEDGNASDIAGNKLGSQFNSQFAEKTFTHFDEIRIKSKDEENSFKMLINAVVEIEKKGIDAKNARNYANIFISANSMDSIKIPPGDRRFSVLDITDTKIVKRSFITNGLKHYAEEVLCSPDNIAQLAKYLWHYPINYKLLEEPFTSKRLEDIRKASLLDWEKHFIASYCRQYAGKAVEVSKAIEDVKHQMNDNLKLRVKSFEQLKLKIKPLMADNLQLFDIKRKRNDAGEHANTFFFAKENEQPPENFVDSFKHITED